MNDTQYRNSKNSKGNLWEDGKKEGNHFPPIIN
jgi:hypothetical protein